MPELQFTPRDWDRVQRDTMAWWEGELDRPLVWLTATDWFPSARLYSFLSNYPLDMPADEVLDRYEPVFAATRFYGDAFPALWVNLGPGIMAGFLGCEVHSVSEPSETVWFDLPTPAALPDLEFTYRADNVWWQRASDFTQAIIARWDGRVAVGHTDLGGNLDILASFRTTENLLLDLIDQPAQVERLVAQITELWLRYYDELGATIRPACRGTTCWTPIWSTGKTYMLQCDFSYMISPAMFERFVLPDLEACCLHLDHGFYHLDGKGEIPHLDHLLSIERLRGIQWIPGDGQPPPERWLPLLKRIRDGGKLCQVFVSAQGALEIARHLGGRGFAFGIYHGGQFNDPQEAEAFLTELYRYS